MLRILPQSKTFHQLEQNHQIRVISLWEALPTLPANKELTAPDRVKPTKYLMIFLDLWLENVCALPFKLIGLL